MIQKTHIFPRIYRFITEQHTELALLSLIVLVALFVVSSDVLSLLEQRQKLQLERQRVLSRIDGWEDVLTKYPGYRDGYLNLAVLEYQFGDFQKSRGYTEKTLQLDPQFTYGNVMGILLDRTEK